MKKFLTILCGILLAAAQICGPIFKPLILQAESDKTIYFTFDDGPTDSTTPKILDVLKQYDVRATFFVIGKQIRGREEIVKRQYLEGHEIAIHTYSHDYNRIYASPGSLKNDIFLCKKAILNVLPFWKSNLYRFPGGSANAPAALRNLIQEYGLHAVDWNASVEDAVRPHANANELFQSAVQSSEGKNTVVLLLHDGVNYRATVECLPDLISYYKNKGYKFKTLNPIQSEANSE